MNKLFDEKVGAWKSIKKHGYHIRQVIFDVVFYVMTLQVHDLEKQKIKLLVSECVVIDQEQYSGG